MLSAGKESFSERPVYLVAYSNDALPDHVAEEAKQIHVEYGRKIDYYWDWPGLPKDGILVSFLVSENGEILRLDGLRERRPALSPKSIVDGTSLELCEKRGGGVVGLRVQRSAWQEAVSWLRKRKFDWSSNTGWNDESGAGFIGLAELSAAADRGECKLHFHSGIDADANQLPSNNTEATRQRHNAN